MSNVNLDGLSDSRPEYTDTSSAAQTDGITASSQGTILTIEEKTQ